jgi:hypothetical protein
MYLFEKLIQDENWSTVVTTYFWKKSPCLEERDEQDRGFGTVYIQYTVRPPSISQYFKEKQSIWLFS